MIGSIELHGSDFVARDISGAVIDKKFATLHDARRALLMAGATK